MRGPFSQVQQCLRKLLTPGWVARYDEHRVITANRAKNRRPARVIYRGRK